MGRHHSAHNATRLDVDRRITRRAQTERLIDLASHLCTQDRVLIEQVYRYGIPAGDIAQLTGESPRSVRRRLTRVLGRLTSPLYGFLVMHRDVLPGPVRRTAELVVFKGYTLRGAAGETGTTLHRVRRDMCSVHAIARL